MILDKFSNIDRYRNINKNFSIAIDYLKNIDVKKLTPGKNNVDGDNVFLVNITRDSFIEQTAIYEMHQEYADIHLVLEDEEYFYFEHPEYLFNVVKPFDKAEDVSLYKLDSTRNKLKLNKDEFAIFFPNEAHVPALLQDKKQMRKIVVKVKC